MKGYSKPWIEKRREADLDCNSYSVMSALFRDAAIDGLIDASPCILTKVRLERGEVQTVDAREAIAGIRARLRNGK